MKGIILLFMVIVKLFPLVQNFEKAFLKKPQFSKLNPVEKSSRGMHHFMLNSDKKLKPINNLIPVFLGRGKYVVYVCLIYIYNEIAHFFLIQN